MSSRTNPPAHRIGAAAIAVALALLGLLAACDTFAAKRPQLMLEIRSQPGDGLAFDPPTISAPAETRVVVSFANVSTLEHNLVFLAPLDSRTREIVRPGEIVQLEFETPAAGNFEFVCTIHEEMRGTLLVR